MKKNICLCVFVSIVISIKAQPNCETSKLLKDLIYQEFGGAPAEQYYPYGYPFATVNEYKKCIYIDTVKNLLVDLISIKWKDEYFNDDVKKNYRKKENFIQQAKKICEKDTNRIANVADSLWQLYIKDIIRERKETFSVSDFNIRLCGYLNLKESIPILQNALKLPKRYDTALVKLTLAKLGDTLVESEFLTSMVNKKDFNFEDFFRKYSPENIDYIGTPKGYYYYSKKLMSKDVLLDGEPGDYSKRQLRNEILTFLVHKIKSEELNKIALELYKKYNPTFYDMFPTRIDFNSTEKMVSDKDIKLVIDWFEKNKGSYILK